jgi:hypothetical protein
LRGHLAGLKVIWILGDGVVAALVFAMPGHIRQIMFMDWVITVLPCHCRFCRAG